MPKTPDTLASIYRAWLARKRLTAEVAAPLVGLAVSTSYEYASGLSVPAGTRVGDFAAKIGHDALELKEIADRDRPLCRRRKARRATHAHRRTQGARA